MLRQAVITALLLCMLALSACAPKAELKFKPTTGEKREYTLRVDEQEKTSIQGMELAQHVKGSNDLTFDVQSIDESGFATIAVTFGKSDIRMSASFAGNEMEFGSEGNDNPMSQVFKTLEGKSFTVTVAENGDVISVQGGSAIAKDVKATLETAIRDAAKEGKIPEEMLPTALAQTGAFDQMFSEDSLRSLVQDLFAPMPPQPVKAGETWTHQSVYKGTAARIDDETFTLDSFEDGVAKLTVQVKSSPNPDAERKGNLGGIPGKMVLSGTGSGTVTFDEHGWATAGEYTKEEKGNFTSEASAMLPISLSVPMTRSGTETVELKQ